MVKSNFDGCEGGKTILQQNMGIYISHTNKAINVICYYNTRIHVGINYRYSYTPIPAFRTEWTGVSILYIHEGDSTMRKGVLMMMKGVYVKLCPNRSHTPS